VYKLPPERLWTTVYETDDEAYDLWTKTIGVPPSRCIRIGDKPGGAKYQSDNFWQMADTGPCGPCSESFYDHGEGIPANSLEQAIRAAAHSPLAARAYAQLERELVLGYTGSSGENVPGDVAARLRELRALSRPTAAPESGT